jgi:hypothetical protein
MHDYAYRNVGLNGILCVLAFAILKKCSFHIGRPNTKQYTCLSSKCLTSGKILISSAMPLGSAYAAYIALNTEHK